MTTPEQKDEKAEGGEDEKGQPEEPAEIRPQLMADCKGYFIDSEDMIYFEMKDGRIVVYNQTTGKILREDSPP